jgi:sigma-E factor negative regulatory protein RseB
MKGGWFLFLASAAAQAAQPLSPADAVAWMQKMADAARHQTYEGVFVVRQGDTLQTLSISNRPSAQGNESRLTAMDGAQREVRCSQTGAVTVVADGNQVRMEKRLNNRYFPDLLPANPLPLINWYEVRLGDMARVAGLDCRNIEILPRDAFRWGYILCADKDSGLPLKAVVVNRNNQPLMQYAFADLKIGTSGYAVKPLTQPTFMPEAARPVEVEHIVARTLPPGYTRIAAVKRHLPNMAGEVEHWVFSDGLTTISLFITLASKPVETVKGESKHGMLSLIRRQVGDYQATVLGDAPWSAVETIAAGLEPKK